MPTEPHMSCARSPSRPASATEDAMPSASPNRGGRSRCSNKHEWSRQASLRPTIRAPTQYQQMPMGGDTREPSTFDRQRRHSFSLSSRCGRVFGLYWDLRLRERSDPSTCAPANQSVDLKEQKLCTNQSGGRTWGKRQVLTSECQEASCHCYGQYMQCQKTSGQIHGI